MTYKKVIKNIFLSKTRAVFVLNVSFFIKDSESFNTWCTSICFINNTFTKNRQLFNAT